MKYLKFKDAIVVHTNGQTHTIHRTDARYQPTLDAINRGDTALKSIVDNSAKEEIRHLLGIAPKRVKQ